MTKIVKAKMWQSGFLEDHPEVFGNIFWVQIYQTPVDAIKFLDHEIWILDFTEARCGLWCLYDKPACVRPYHRLAYNDRIPGYVRICECTDLAPAKGAESRQEDSLF